MKWFEDNPEILKKDKLYILQNYPDLHFQENTISISIIGIIQFKKIINKIELSNSYFIKIDYDKNHPKFCPKIFEKDSKIEIGFHKNKDDELCLETPNGIYEIFRKDESIKNYIENLVIPFLYCHTYFSIHNKMPWGEWAHGGEGLHDYYSEIFQLNDLSKIITLLRYFISTNKFIGILPCPCKSKKNFRQCHKNILRLKLIAPPEELEKNMNELRKYSERH